MIVSLQVKKLLALCVVNSVMCVEKNQQTTQKKAKVSISKSGKKEALGIVLGILLFYLILIKPSYQYSGKKMTQKFERLAPQKIVHYDLIHQVI